ncbi:hypothetical protein J41TS12_48900 [Paenibacillus antibioticophila]|uniref:Uncharacterized protein n=1 Tax=Paenibacillus antibioticophila TaxID=1274374 RepID=A0A920CK14_9BACL|nr:hypothetical protein J41TS12_48900 [Paenibacillus antibioticophila]
MVADCDRRIADYHPGRWSEFYISKFLAVFAIASGWSLPHPLFGGIIGNSPVVDQKGA